MTVIRCLATNCEFNDLNEEHGYSTCQKDEVFISVWDVEDDEYMACKSFVYGKPVKYRGE